MGAWIDQNPEAFLTLILMLVGVVVYVVRMEGKVGKLESRVTACEGRAEEDRAAIKERLDSIDGTMSDVKSSVDRLVGALHGRRIGDPQVERL
jgi:tetrahydromethanopterin S-methyltransferase subunit G